MSDFVVSGRGNGTKPLLEQRSGSKVVARTKSVHPLHFGDLAVQIVGI